MKLNTLLLASAATLVASAAFAADLPSKKAAPAAGSVAVCKVGGMTGFTLPGSDTCLGISGYARFDGTYVVGGGEDENGDGDIPDSESDDGSLDWSAWGGKARVNFDARSNTEVGVVRSFIALEGTNGGIVADRAYVQFAGVSAGRKDSIANVLGTQSDAFSLASQQKEGIDYQIKAGGLNFGVGLEAPNNNNDDGDQTADGPDVVAHLSGSVGSVNFAVAAASHEAFDWTNDVTQGSAFMGNINTTVNGLRLGVFGAMATNASAYTGGARLLSDDGDGDWYSGLYDYNEGRDLDSQMYGVSAVYSAGKLTVGAEFARYEASSEDYDDSSDLYSIDTDAIAVFAGYQVAKGLTLYTEYYSVDQSYEEQDGDTGSEDTQTVLFRIQRDF